MTGGAGCSEQPQERVAHVEHRRLLEPVDTDALSEAELLRYGRFRHQLDRDRFAAGATLLRVVAGRVLGSVPEQLVIDRTCGECGKDHGRPRFGRELGLWGSVAHSGRHVAVAVSTSGPVGLDVEDPRRGTSVAEPSFLRQVFAPSENASTNEWLATWVRKEALLKLSGTGLRYPMSSIRLAPAGPQGRALIEPPAMLVGAIVRDLQVNDAEAAVATFGPARLVGG